MLHFATQACVYDVIAFLRRYDIKGPGVREGGQGGGNVLFREDFASGNRILLFDNTCMHLQKVRETVEHIRLKNAHF